MFSLMFRVQFLQNNGKAGYNVGDSQSNKTARGDDISETIQKPLVRQANPFFLFNPSIKQFLNESIGSFSIDNANVKNEELDWSIE